MLSRIHKESCHTPYLKRTNGMRLTKVIVVLFIMASVTISLGKSTAKDDGKTEDSSGACATLLEKGTAYCGTLDDERAKEGCLNAIKKTAESGNTEDCKIGLSGFK